MNYGEIIKTIRLEKNLTQEDIAKNLNIARITYSHYESQERIIPIERLNNICNFYNISLDYALGITDKKQYKNSKKDISIIAAGTRLREYRKIFGLTQKNLAKFLGTTQSVIAEYERGRFLINTPFVYQLCKEYKISADYLLGKIDKKITLK